MGTPAYVSPEMIRGDTVDHRSDIFAFGCVLYELLTGRTPFDLSNLSPAQAERRLLEGDPPRPSVAARQTAGSVDGLSSAAWSDLDVLCLTAMETAVAAAEAIDPELAPRLAEVRPLGAWVPQAGVPGGQNRTPVAPEQES